MASSRTNIAGYNDAKGTHGPHTSRAANAADPFVDSDRDHRGAPVTSGAGVTSPAEAHGGAAGATAPTGSSGQPAAGTTGPKISQGIKGVFAQGHGIGETLRGNINAAIDDFTGDREKEARDQEVASKGKREFQNREFEGHTTSERRL